MTHQITIRPESPDDIPAIRAVNMLAFPTDAEAHLVDSLRQNGLLTLSLVAGIDDRIVGHIAFSPVTVSNESTAAAAGRPFAAIGLAPMAVLPEYQNRGVGTRLVNDGLDRLRAMNVPAVFVLGHKEYYPRFGFVPALRFGIRSIYPDTDDVFFALELIPGALNAVKGTLRYSAPFDSL